MAQAVYDDHPLDQYLRESGDVPEYVPGAFPGAATAEEGEDDIARLRELVLSSPSAARALQAVHQSISSFRSLFPSPIDDLAERFRYDLISSNLLASSIPSTPTATRSHSRRSSSSPVRPIPGELVHIQSGPVEKSDQEQKVFSGTFICAAFVALMNQYRVFSILLMVASCVLTESKKAIAPRRKHSVQVFEFLDGLKNAASAWDASVNDAITIISAEERSARHLSSASYNPSSALRIALHSILTTTQHQCDNVRPLLAALSSPTELSQLSEMYAPPSPKLQTLTLHSRVGTPARKQQPLPGTTTEGSPGPRSPQQSKRRSWAGTHSRNSSVIKKRDRRRSDINSVFQAQGLSLSIPSSSSPISPTSPPLMQVPEADENEEGEDQDDIADLPFDESELPRDNFGTAALYLRRKRRISGFEALGLASSRSDPSLRNSIHDSSPSSISSSRFTSMSTSRHPLSLSALDQALQGAMASRRYACAHLLALRFKEDADDEVYWENVRSVTELLTATLQDAASRLNDALEEADDFSRREGEPTPDVSPKIASIDELFGSLQTCTSDNDCFSPPPSNFSTAFEFPLSSSSNGDVSFAPAPSHLVRFASHVDAITTSLSDAKSYLADSLEELKELQRGSTTIIPESSADIKASEQSVMEAYERLRSELAITLREYERGRQALVDVFQASRAQSKPIDDSGDEDTITGRARRDTDSGSSGDSRDKIDIGPLTPGDGSPIMPSFRSLHLVTDLTGAGTTDQTGDDDDATQHLLLGASSLHLPSPGAEQVFEADSATAAAFTRERSKLTREERIKMMRAKRESMNGRGLAAFLEDQDERPVRENWGPSTDVVEELKDVIWKVSERRRRISDDVTRRRRTSLIPIPVKTSNALEKTDYDTSLSTS